MGQQAVSSVQGRILLAREPILTRKHRIIGYHVRVGQPAGPRAPLSPHDDVLRLAESCGAAGLQALTHGQMAFVGISRDTLLAGAPLALPSSHVVLELGSDTESNAEVRDACSSWRARGYRIAIDDFSVTAPAAGLAACADYLKVDVSVPLSTPARARTVACFSPGVTALIAKGVETFEQFEAAAQDGFVCFEGFFFGRPLLLPGRESAGHQMAVFRLLRALNDPNLSLGQLEDLVKHDAALCYRVLRTVNSAAFAIQTTITSIQQGLLLLGRDTIRRWASLWAVAGLNESAHSELVIMSTVRARLCELVAGRAYGEAAGSEAFLLGMCSLLDLILGRPMDAIAAELPIDDTTRRALCGEANAARDVLDCVIAYERGAWAECEAIAKRAKIDSAMLAGAYLEALRWSSEFRDPA